MEKKLEFTRTSLIKAFEKWNKDFIENPDDFNEKLMESNHEQSAIDSADTLIEYLIGKGNLIKD